MHVIDIRLRHPDQLFDSLDPSPFHDKALDRNAEAYLIECAGELPPRDAFVLRLYGPAVLHDQGEQIMLGVHRHFALALAQAQRRHRRRARVARAAILFGLAGLGGALLLRSAIAEWGGAGGEVLTEGLLILAWVALWRPAEMLIFDSWEQREELRVLRALTRVPVQVAVDAGEDAPAAATTGPR
jgi:hypothetical protein